jgi:uncharacterized SAM-binding protein YcdF (DUF218 family)
MSSFNDFRTCILGFLPARHLKQVPPMFKVIGLDGLTTLLLANLFIAATGGIALLWRFYKVYRVGRSAPSSTSHMGCRLILGERLRAGAVSANFEERLARGLTLQGAGPILVVGGPSGARISEARAGRDWLLAHGAEVEEIDIEENSRNTLENLIAARSHFITKKQEFAIIISSRYHMARCDAIARGLGLRYFMCASDEYLEMGFNNIRRMLVEAYFLNWYFTGKAWAAWTGNRKMLQRIQ